VVVQHCEGEALFLLMGKPKPIANYFRWKEAQEKDKGGGKDIDIRDDCSNGNEKCTACAAGSNNERHDEDGRLPPGLLLPRL
jgi:hypothetical protein